MSTKRIPVGGTAWAKTYVGDKYVDLPVTVTGYDERGLVAFRYNDGCKVDGHATESGWHVGNLSATQPKPLCAHCNRNRTSKPLCASCQSTADRKRRAMAKVAKTPGTAANLGSVEALLASIATPAGWTRETTTETWNRRVDATAWPVLVLRGDGIELRIVGGRVDDEYYVATGHTTFTTAKGERTFDRTGVEDSFYVRTGDTAATVAATIAEQVQRVAASRERLARSETVPGLPGGWSVTPERKAEIASLLRNGKSYSFTPAGFGTGYCVFGARFGRPRSDAQRLPASTTSFFGVDMPLYYTPLDCD